MRYYETEGGIPVKVPEKKWVPCTWKRINRKAYDKLIKKERR